MEGTAKDSGHRASVSMPSLDANDDFPTRSTSTEGTESEFTTDATFVSTASTETVLSSAHTDLLTTDTVSDLLTTDTVSFSSVDTLPEDSEQPVQTQGSTDEATTVTVTDGSAESLIDNSPSEALETSAEPVTSEGSSLEPLINEASTLISEASTSISEPSTLISEPPTLISEPPTLLSEPSTLISEPSTEQLINAVPADHLIHETSAAEAGPADTLLDETSEDLQQEDCLDDSQGEEDPSIAIDQFIKKIADEQLSSKRIEERKEEEAKEQIQETGSDSEQTGNLENSMLDEKNNTQEETAASSFENKVTEEEDQQTNCMEVDSAPVEQFKVVGTKETDNSSTEALDSGDNQQMESIEEIQKEINRIPPKKSTINEDKETTAQNGTLEDTLKTQSIEKMLEEDLGVATVPAGDILKGALNKSSLESAIGDSTDVARDPILIEKAQEELRKLDVLVCGECHNTFYFTQEFTDHKQGKCTKKSILTGVCENESKPQVWGFILWKIKQTKDLSGNVPSSWSIYQRWCKLPQVDKNAWITAGQAIQFASKVGNARVTEVRPAKQKQVIVHKVVDQPPPIEFVDSNKENSSSMEVENTATNIIKKGISKPVKLNNDVTIMPSTKKEEYVVEKIMAKRFNPRKKTWEYNIKWENFGHDSNTWEPINNLSHCKTMLEQFEEQLRRMKEEKAKQAAQSPKGRGRPSNPKAGKPTGSNFIPIAPKLDSTPKISNVVGGVSEDYAGGSSGRPTRSSKQNALSQMKQWCDNISDDDSGGVSGLKRKHESDYSDDDFDDKRIKLEEDSDYSDKEIKAKISIKKVTSTPRQTPVKNGSSGAQQILPSNILIPDANGVVRINQKQLPSLSSGVYIMSKTAGIIKLDSTTSKVATSGGQTIVKVAPKIGQTQIKIVKKDGNTTKQIIQVSPKPLTASQVSINTSKVNTSRFAPKLRKDIVRRPVGLSDAISKIVTTTAKRQPETPPVSETAPVGDESDDGLEPLPFPGPDEPIPDLEEVKEAEEFVLDPSTGKIAGIEYVDKPVVIKEEPQPVPPSTNDLENIVKLAAAEITESDSQHSDGQMEMDPLFMETDTEVKSTVVRQSPKIESRPSATGIVRKVVKYTTGQGMKSESSILNKVLTQGAPRAVISPVKISTPVQVPRPRVVQQRVINQMVSRTPTGSSGSTRTVVRHVIGPQRPSAGGNLNVIRKTIAPAPKPRFNLTPQKPLPSPLQPTRTYSAMGGIRQQNVGGKVQVYSTKNVPGNQTSPIQQGGMRRIGNTIVRSSSTGQTNIVQKQQPVHYQTQKQPITRIVQRVVTSPRKAEGQTVVTRTVTPAQTKAATSVKPKAIISMPSLAEEETPTVSSPKIVQKPLQAVTQTQKSVPQLAKPSPVKQEVPVKVEETPINTEEAEGAANAEQGTDWSSFTMADGDNPIYVTGDDGTIYQVAGQNEQGQTILITQGPDGQQQCLLVTNEIGEMTPDDQPSTSIDNASAATAEPEDSAMIVQEHGTELAGASTAVPESVQTPLQIKTDNSEMEGIEDGMQDQVVAQVVRAEPPSPGGTHKVVVMLPDGSLMVTQVSPEEYASLELE